MIGFDPLPCCKDRPCHGGPDCVWPGERTYTLDEWRAAEDAYWARLGTHAG